MTARTPITYADVTCPNWCQIPREVRHSVCTGTWAGPGNRQRGVQVRPEAWPIDGPVASLTARQTGHVLHINLTPDEAAELHTALGTALTQIGVDHPTPQQVRTDRGQAGRPSSDTHHPRSEAG